MTGRLRRTRIYGANYNIGESYYKPTLDILDQKRDSRNETVLLGTPKTNLSNEGYLAQPNKIFQSGIHEGETSLFDYSGRELNTHLAPDIPDELDEDIRYSMRRMRELKDSSPSFLTENTAFKERNTKNLFDAKYLQNLKVEHDFDDYTSGMSMAASDILKSTSSAARANATKERLASIDFEMSERSEKQVQREKRSANLKKILSEAGTENSKVVKKVTF